VTGDRLAGRAVLVVGASAGIGKACAVGAVRAGAKVVLAARRAERLAAAVEQAGGGVAIPGDACDAGDCERVVAEAVGLVGPLDLVVYAAGAAPLRALADTTAAEWERVLATNVVGANQVVRAAVPRLAAGGIVAVLSSEAAHTPRYGLGAYGASKAALEASIRSWRNEHPETRFASVVVGQTFPTEFGDGFEPDVLAAAFEHWGRHGLLQSEFMTPEGVAGVLLATLGTALAHPEVGVHDIVLRSPSAPVGPVPATAADQVAIGGRRPSESAPGTKPPWVTGDDAPR
jgi:NAD(P)-dependent dehydrogenase (short-subunit alcohol dehydrogenase family)